MLKRLCLFCGMIAGGAYANSNGPYVSVNLGTAASFGVLAGSGVTNVSSETLITGDVGSSPTPAVTGLLATQVIGDLYLTPSATTAQAQVDLSVGYGEAASAPCGTNLTGQDLGGLTLTPGVYCFSSSALLTGTLTLDAQNSQNAQWIFQMGSTLTTATGATVVLVNGASKCNVFWQVGSSATIQTGNTFVGNILALASITLDGGTLNGRALASTGAVTIAAQETIDNSGCTDCTVFVTSPAAGTVSKLTFPIPFEAGSGSHTIIATGITSGTGLVCAQDQNLYIAISGVYGGKTGIARMDQYGWVDATFPFSKYPVLAGSGGPAGLAFQPGTTSLFFSTTLSKGLSNSGTWEMSAPLPVQVMSPMPANGSANGGGPIAFLTAGPYAGNLLTLDVANGIVLRVAPPFTSAQSGINFITTNLVGPQGLVVNPAGNVFVSNSDGSIAQFGNDGTYLGQFANTGLHNMNMVSRKTSLFVVTQEGPVFWIQPSGVATVIGTVVGAAGLGICQSYQ